jgi:hypothetical protein
LAKKVFTNQSIFSVLENLENPEIVFNIYVLY